MEASTDAVIDCVFYLYFTYERAQELLLKKKISQIIITALL